MKRQEKMHNQLIKVVDNMEQEREYTGKKLGGNKKLRG